MRIEDEGEGEGEGEGGARGWIVSLRNVPPFDSSTLLHSDED